MMASGFVEVINVMQKTEKVMKELYYLGCTILMVNGGSQQHNIFLILMMMTKQIIPERNFIIQQKVMMQLEKLLNPTVMMTL